MPLIDFQNKESVYLGSTEAQKVYLGSDLVWEKPTGVPVSRYRNTLNLYGHWSTLHPTTYEIVGDQLTFWNDLVAGGNTLSANKGMGNAAIGTKQGISVVGGFGAINIPDMPAGWGMAWVAIGDSSKAAHSILGGSNYIPMMNNGTNRNVARYSGVSVNAIELYTNGVKDINSTQRRNSIKSLVINDTVVAGAIANQLSANNLELFRGPGGYEFQGVFGELILFDSTGMTDQDFEDLTLDILNTWTT